MKKMKKKKWLIPLIIVLIVAFTACTAGNGNNADKEDPPPVVDETPDKDTSGDQEPGTDSTNKDNNAVAYEDIKLTPLDAFDSYMEKYPNTKVKKVELDQDFGSYVYKVEGFDGEKEYELDIHPITGEIIKEDTDMEKDNDGEITKAHVEKVQKIVEGALKEAGEGAKLDQWTLEMEKGKVQVEVEIDKEGFDDVENTYDIEGNLLEKDE